MTSQSKDESGKRDTPTHNLLLLLVFCLIHQDLIVLKFAGILKVSWFWALFPSVLLVSVVAVTFVIALVIGIVKAARYWR